MGPVGSARVGWVMPPKGDPKGDPKGGLMGDANGDSTWQLKSIRIEKAPPGTPPKSSPYFLKLRHNALWVCGCRRAPWAIPHADVSEGGGPALGVGGVQAFERAQFLLC